MITKEQYEKAILDKQAAELTLRQYHEEKAEAFKNRLKTNPTFLEDELIYASFSRCPCGYGLAYPKECGGGHYWDCAGILLGKATENSEHTGRLPFAFYEINSENQPSACGATTRGTVEPKPQ